MTFVPYADLANIIPSNCVVNVVVVLKCFTTSSFPPKGGRVCLMSPSCLESDCYHLIPLYYLFSCSSAESYYSFCLFFCLLAHSDFFKKKSSILFVKRYAFLYGSCLAARRRQLVGGMCSMLPYDTGIYCYAFM